MGARQEGGALGLSGRRHVELNVMDRYRHLRNETRMPIDGVDE